jgi:type VI protein secretion system component VasK
VDLTQLRDIHLPPPVSGWPPAPGWWLLLAALIVVIILLVVVRRRWRGARWRRKAQRAIAQLRQRHREKPEQGRAVVEQLSVLMRRVATTRFPGTGAASLCGEPWLQFLASQSKNGTAFVQGSGRLLADAPYRPKHVNISEVESLLKLCEQWIVALPGGRA